MSYVWTEDARQDLYEAVAFYDGQREGLGLELAIEIGRGIEVIMEAPQRWERMDPGIHKYRLDRFPYALLYRVNSMRSIEIIALFDLRSRPGSWKREA